MLKNDEVVEEFKRSLIATIKSIGKSEAIEVNFVKEDPGNISPIILSLFLLGLI